jgi:hypothetical protein
MQQDEISNNDTLFPLSLIYIVYVFPARQPVNIKVFVQTDDFPYAGFFGGDDQGGVREVHGQVRVLIGQFQEPGHIVLVDVADKNALVYHPLVKTTLCSLVKIQHMGDFSKDRQGAYIAIEVCLEESLNLRVMLIA